MTAIVGFFIILSVILLGLSVALVIVFVKLGRELQQVSHDTESMLVKLQRGIRTVRFAAPLVVLSRGIATNLLTKIRSLRKKKVS